MSVASPTSRRTIRVVAAVVQRNDRYLITQRRATAVLPLLWEFPGGRVEDGESDAAVVGAVEKVARERGVPMAQIALAWVLTNPVVTAPIVGATKPHHLVDAVAALDIQLTDDELTALEGPYVSRPPSYFS